ncbi:hypothetical protein BGZ67_009318 [Mortierella alpina]|nr:hypothetical protein BGZ67_009318 [Mortierella alpina]
MPLFDGLFQPWRSTLSPQQALKLAQLQLEAASNADGDPITLLLCEQAEANLDRIKRPESSSVKEDADYQDFRKEIAAAYCKHAGFMSKWKYAEKAQVSRTKSEKWGGVSSTDEAAVLVQRAIQEHRLFPDDIFDTDDAQPSTIPNELPEVNKPLTETRQLAYCLAVLNTVKSPEIELPTATREWVQAIEKDQDEQRRLRELAKSLVRAFIRDELKDADAIAEVTYMAPVLEKAEFRSLLKLFINSLKDSALLEIHSLEGIAQLLGSTSDTVEADDLVKTLRYVNANLQGIHSQSEDYIYRLTTTVSRVLDAMADGYVTGVERENLHQPLRDYLESLKGSDDPYLVFHAAYAFQALLCVPNDESAWEATVRKSGRILNGIFQLVGAMKALDVNSFIDGLCTLQTGLGEVYAMAERIRDEYIEVQSLYNSGRELKAALQDVSFKSRRSWYTALRGADTLLRNGHLANFKKLVCDAPCRRALAFQWGVCLRMGNLAVDSQWDEKHRCDAISFLGHLYRDDHHWGHHVPVKQLIIDILMQLSKSSKNAVQASAKALLKELKVDDNSDKRAMLQSCLDSGPSPHPLMAAMSLPSLSALLDRAQGKVDVEADLKRLRLACEQRRVEAVYIPPKAKAGLQALDTDLFDLKEKADAFLAHEEQKVLLLLGESGIGKSTFNMRLELQLWSEYKKHTGRIPLFINLPAIDRPEQDLIAKQLRKLQFEEPQIRELKKRRFVLICDGYDESQQTHNLYRNNLLDQKEEWQAQMVISCRSEYVGTDYKHRFQPGDRNQPSTPGQFQEAVVMPFDEVQIEKYIKSFVDLEKPLWSAENYIRALEMFPSLRELVKNPFLLKLSLDVLPRLVEQEQKDLTDAKVTRVALYDQFLEQWLERGKKRLVEKEMSEQERKAFHSLSDEGFALRGISFLKRLAADVYDKQGGNPVIEYSRVEVGGSWKDNYFSRDDNIQLLREACPLTRSGNQYRFIHRSILEYALARAVFEPRNGGIGVEKTEPATSTLKRRGSVDSAYSFEVEGALQDNASPIEQGPDPDSPLVRRYYVGEPSILQFLEERLQQEPDFRKQLLAYIDASKSQKTLRIAAANAITILVRSGEQFYSADLQGIRIPGANLSLGMFDSAQLQNADLRKVKLSSVWLGGANLSGARMSGVEFGELPYLQEDHTVSRCIYSPDGSILMTILESGSANVYSALTWEKKWSVDRTVKIDTRIAFSPNSKVIAGFIGRPSPQERELEATWQLASESDACAVYLWETETGGCRILQGHTARITGVAYSPRGGMVASCSDDDTIRLWNTSTGACNCSLYVPPVCSIAFSPSGDRLALACKDGQWWLWDVDANTFIESFSFEAHSHFTQVIFSPTGTKVVIGGTQRSSNNVHLWDMRSRTRTKVGFINGHFPRFKHIVFSLKCDKLATISEEDGRVVIWNTETAESRHLLKSNGEEYLDAAFSPKGDLIATGGRNQIVRLWDVETGVCRGSMSGHSGIIRSVAFSPDGRHIASGSDDMQVRLWEVNSTTRINLGGSSHIQLSAGHSASGDRIFSVSGGDTVHVWDMKTGQCPQSMTEPGFEAKSIALSRSGNHIASGTTDGNIHFWNLENGVRSSVLSGDNYAVNSVTYSPKGDQIASCSGWAVKVWDTETARCLHNFSGHDEDQKIHTVAYSPEGGQFASVAKDSKVVRLWDVEIGTCRMLQGHSFWITSITYSPNGGEIASCSLDNTVRLWDTTSGLCRLVLSGHEDLVYKALYSPDGDEIASCSEDNTVRLWNVETGTCRSTLVCRGSEGVASIAYSPAGDIIASVGYCETAQLWNVKTGSCLLVLTDIPKASTRNILFSPRGDLVAIDSGSKDGRIMGLWDVATGSRCRTFKEFFLQASAPLFSPDGYQILCPESETTLRVWDVESEACLHTLVHEGAINDVQYSAKGDHIASASQDTTVKLWDSKSGLCLYTIQNHRSGVDRIAFSPKNGDQIVLGGENGSIRLWDAISKTLTRYFSGHGGAVNSVAFSPNKHLVASGSDDTTVCLWNLETASLKRVFEGHVMSVQCVAFSPSGNYIASGSKDKSIRLWDVEEGTCRTLTGASDEILCIAYSPENGELLASGSRNMTVRLWNVVTGETWTIIKGGYEIITSVEWGTANYANHLVTGCSDTSVRVWRVVQEEGKPYRTTLHWSSMHGALFVAGCDLQGVKGLTEANKRLLMQRGASGKPEPRKTLKDVATAVRATSTVQKLGKTAMASEE